MLVLTRKKNEMIHIGEGIVIKVIHTGHNTVKIGIEAPREIRVLRSELRQPAEGEGHDATTAAGPVAIKDLLRSRRIRAKIHGVTADAQANSVPHTATARSA